MRNYLLLSILFMIALHSVALAAEITDAQLKLNQEFAPFMATERLNEEYKYALLFSDANRKIYFIQSSHYYSMLGVYNGNGELCDLEFIEDNALLTPIDKNRFKLIHSFDLPGLDTEIQGYSTTLQDCAIQVLQRYDNTVLYLEQRFLGGGTGGHHDGILRKYLIITTEHIYITTDYQVITFFHLSYPRTWGDTWTTGYMEYSHCYDVTTSLQKNNLVVTCAKQEFRMDNLFETEELAKKSKDTAPNGWWGEGFRYNHFSVPREPNYTYEQETQIFPLEVVE